MLGIEVCLLVFDRNQPSLTQGQCAGRSGPEQVRSAWLSATLGLFVFPLSFGLTAS